MYLLRVKGRGPRSVAQVPEEELHVQYAQRFRTKRIHQSGLGPIREVEEVGAIKSKLQITTSKGIRGDGNKLHPPHLVVPVADVKEHVRRLRRQEAKEIAALDSKIEQRRQEIFVLRTEREEAVRSAWSRANVVPQKELVAKADERARERAAAASNAAATRI